jgi:hypothetical protein
LLIPININVTGGSARTVNRSDISGGNYQSGFSKSASSLGVLEVGGLNERQV